MKTNNMIMGLALCMIAGGAYAQTTYDAARLSDNDLNGTARFVGMGGAMGALGGDITTTGTNPAGVGIFRSSEISATVGVQGAKFGDENKTIPTFDQIGAVFSTKYGENTSLKYVNFGFNYRRKKDFNANLNVDYNANDLKAPNGDQMSQTYVMERMLPSNATLSDAVGFRNGFPNNVPGSNIIGGAGSLAQLGVLGYLTYDPNWSDFDYRPATSANYYSEQTGGIDELDMTVAFNLNNQFYFGATLSGYNVNYDLRSVYTEYSTIDNGSYTLTNWQSISGQGIDAKLGMIIRPVETSPFRIGLAVHTPTWYNLTNTYNVMLASNYIASGDNTFGLAEMEWDYQMTTPWKFNVSLGHTVGTLLAIGAEYEFEDYSASRFADDSGYRSDYDIENNRIKDALKGVHTIRLGVEAKLVPEVSLRLGYNYSTAAFDKGAYNNVDDYHYTETAYMNGFDKNIFTAGLGYRGRNFYADLAYQFNTQKIDFYAFDDEDLVAKSVKLDRNKVQLTLGYRF